MGKLTLLFLFQPQSNKIISTLKGVSCLEMYSKEQTEHGLLLIRNLNKLEKLADIIEFSKDKCKVVPWVE